MLRLILGWVLVNALLMGPRWLSASVTEGQAGWVALEAAMVVGLLAILPERRLSTVLAWAAAVAVVLVTVIGFADVVFQVSLARPLSLFLNLYLMSAVYHLAVGNMGLATALVAIGSVLVALALVTLGLARVLAPVEMTDWAHSVRLAPRIAGIALVTVAALGLTREATPGVQGRLSLPVVDLIREQAEQLRLTLGERERFQSELAAAPDSYADVPGLLGKLRDTDVLLTFIESYGMAAVDDPEFAAVIRPRLDTLATRMANVGIHLATGSLTSSTQGGQSWFAHGTAISGLWLNNQLRYDLLMASDRETLVDDFRHAGHRTATVMPAITMTWPEGIRLRYDDVYTRSEIDYAGPSLYWVTMPDQFTWSFLQRTVRSAAGDQPLFVEAAMVSSHAPWTPVLPMVDWDSIGDGAAFAPFKQEGHPPEELWIDTDLLRHSYARSLDYSLQAMAGFAERYLDDRTLLIVMGDHQAAPWVTGATSADVPVHVFTRDPALLQPFLDWGFHAGAFPSTERELHRMDEFRNWFVHAYSEPGAAAVAPSPTEGS